MLRNAIREDVRYFLLPALLVIVAGGAVSVWDLIRRESLRLDSVGGAAGLVFVVLGLTILFVASGTLRRFYSSTLVIREGHELITTGIYRLVRHPIYLGAILVLLGMQVFVSSTWGFLTMSILIPLFLNRIRIEERMLTDQFGDAYREYREATKKLVPYIY